MIGACRDPSLFLKYVAISMPCHIRTIAAPSRKNREGGLITVEVTGAPGILVRDQGLGFPGDVLDAEFRCRGLVRSGRRDGAGPGLSIVERTMLAHGGNFCSSTWKPTGAVWKCDS